MFPEITVPELVLDLSRCVSLDMLELLEEPSGLSSCE